ncbi:MAG: hypothetical protein RIS44_2958 [Pseudomonadota bacterium]|jgi:hypothetical protein
MGRSSIAAMKLPGFYPALLTALSLAVPVLHCDAQGVGAEARPSVVASTTSAPTSTRPTGKIYQQRQKDGSILFTDRPADTGGVTERSWTVPTEDPEVAEKRREKARQEAKQEAQALNDRLQRQIERQQDRDEALAIERMRLNQAQAQRDAEIARADRERSERERAVPPVIVVVPGQRPRHNNPPIGGLPPPYVARPATPPLSRPSASVCTAKKPSDCNPSGDPARAGFGGR